MPRQIQPKVTFYIDSSNSDKSGRAPIKANVTINGKKITRIMEHTLASDWNDNQQRVRPPRPGKWNGHDLINEKLDNLQKDFDEFVKRSAITRIEITPEIVKSYLKGERNFSEKPFWVAYDEYIETKIIETKTRQNYKLYFTKLKEFEKDKGYKIDYHTINSAFFELYKGYILTEKELSWNTLATAVKKLKFFMNWSLKNQYHNETGFREFSCTEKEPTVIFLTMDELTTLYRFNYSTKRLNQVRDRFCFGCFTSLSFADLDNLKPEHINNGILKKYRQKSKILHEIVLPEAAIGIINRYQGHFKTLPKISHQKFNGKEKKKVTYLKRNIAKFFPKR